MPEDELDIITSAAEFYTRLYSELASARESIRVQIYCLEEGPLTEEFQRILLDRTARGVRVELMYDSVGSMGVSSGYFDRLSEGGVTVVEYNPINPRRAKRPFRLGRFFRRNHRKLFIIDSRVFYLGGMNMGERFLDWEDVMIRGEGGPVEQLETSFDMVWDKPPLVERVMLPRPATGQKVEVYDCVPKTRNYPAKRLYIAAIKRSRYRVWIAQAYFIPRRKIVKALIRAAARGVDVRIVMPDRSDVKMADLAAWPVIKRLLKHGITVSRFTGRMMHSKFAVIDDHWVTVGTANLDSMSLYWNIELNLVIRDPQTVAVMAGIFTDYESRSRVVGRDELRQRPLSLQLLGRLLYYYSWIL